MDGYSFYPVNITERKEARTFEELVRNMVEALGHGDGRKVLPE